MKAFQILLLNTFAVATLAQLGSRNHISNSSNSIYSRGGFPYPHSYRRRRSSERSYSVSDSESRGFGSLYTSQERGGKGSRSNTWVSSEESVYPYIYRWRRSNEMGTSNITPGSVGSKAGYPDHHSSRQRRQSASDFGYRNSPTTFRFGNFRGVFLNPRYNWHSRDEGVSLRTGSRAAVSNVENSKGGYPFPHSCRRRRSDGSDTNRITDTVSTRNQSGVGGSE